MPRYVLSGLLVLALSTSLGAQEFIVDKQAEIPRARVAPIIDGTVSAQEWHDAILIGDLYQVFPNQYAPPSEKTEFLLKYDADYLYVGARVYESDPDNIVAQVTRQGATIKDDDYISIVLDPNNAKRGAYRFILNLNSVRNEGIYVNTSEFSDNWTTIWDGSSQRTDYGWSAEMAVPFKSLSFPANNEIWGVNLLRKIARKNEVAGWVSQNRAYDASVSGNIAGFAGLNQGMGLDVVPSVSITNSRDYSPQIDEQTIEPSVDMFYKITPSLNAALTVNTDFSATEVDDQQVSLGQFDLFFPEKRDFFLREFDVFDFGGIGQEFTNNSVSAPELHNARPFFSRRIGLSAGGEVVDLIGGAKISGRLGDYDLGALVVRQDEFVPPNPNAETIDSSTLFVGRLAADVLEESSIGAILTQGDPQSNRDNRLMGVDFRYRQSQSPIGRIDATAWMQQSDTPGLAGNDAALGLYFSVPNLSGWNGLAQYQRIEENFNPAMGFLARANVDMKRASLGHYTRLPEHPWINAIYTGIEGREWRYLDDNRLQSSFIKFRPLRIETDSNDKIEFFYNWFGEGVWPNARQPFAQAGILLPHGKYRWHRGGVMLESSRARRVNFATQAVYGGYFNGDRYSQEIELGWRVSPNFRMSAITEFWDVDLPQGDFNLRQTSARTEWAFNANLSWVNVLQYNNIDAGLGVNSRLHWTPRAGQNIYLVLSHDFNELDDQEFVSTSSELTLKASYTLRF